jgi:tetratricopeptide (TPR) repeat protein
MIPSSRLARACLRRALVLSLAAAAPGAAQTQQPQPQQPPRATDARQILDRASALHRSGELERAVREYQAFLKLHPDVADVRSNLGAAYVQLGQLEKAIEQYRRALALGNASDATAVRFNLGLAYYKAARLDEAAAALAAVVKASPGNTNALLLLATCRLASGQNRAVIELLSPRESKLRGDRAFAYLLGTALLRDGQLERGQALVDVVLGGGESAEARFMLGTAHLARGDPSAAAPEFQRARELNPELPSVNAFLGKCLQEMSRSDEAAEAYRRELRLNPNDFDSNLLLGMHVHKAEQDPQKALAYYERALRVRPGSPNARYQIALVHLDTGREDEALAMIEGVVEDVPDFLEGHATLTRLYYRLGRRQDAERHRAAADELRARRESQDVAGTRPPSP